MSAWTRRLYSNIQGNFFLVAQKAYLLLKADHSCFLFVRTFPAAIAGRGDYFHYDINTKEAVGQSVSYSQKINTYMKNELIQCSIDFEIAPK